MYFTVKVTQQRSYLDSDQSIGFTLCSDERNHKQENIVWCETLANEAIVHSKLDKHSSFKFSYLFYDRLDYFEIFQCVAMNREERTDATEEASLFCLVTHVIKPQLKSRLWYKELLLERYSKTLTIISKYFNILGGNIMKYFPDIPYPQRPFLKSRYTENSLKTLGANIYT